MINTTLKIVANSSHSIKRSTVFYLMFLQHDLSRKTKQNLYTSIQYFGKSICTKSIKDSSIFVTNRAASIKYT